jgi:hypothetical protein
MGEGGERYAELERASFSGWLLLLRLLFVETVFSPLPVLQSGGWAYCRVEGERRRSFAPPGGGGGGLIGGEEEDDGLRNDEDGLRDSVYQW